MTNRNCDAARQALADALGIPLAELEEIPIDKVKIPKPPAPDATESRAGRAFKASKGVGVA